MVETHRSWAFRHVGQRTDRSRRSYIDTERYRERCMDLYIPSLVVLGKNCQGPG